MSPIKDRKKITDEIYFLQSGKGPIKIGWSNNIKKRLPILQVGNPEKLILLKVIQGSISGEKEIHKRFAKHKIWGEWFRPIKELMDFIELLPRCYMSIQDKKIFYKHVAITKRYKFRQVLHYDLEQFGDNPQIRRMWNF